MMRKRHFKALQRHRAKIERQPAHIYNRSYIRIHQRSFKSKPIAKDDYSKEFKGNHWFKIAKGKVVSIS